MKTCICFAVCDTLMAKQILYTTGHRRKAMGLFSDLRMKGRKVVAEPDGAVLFKGAVLMVFNQADKRIPPLTSASTTGARFPFSSPLMMAMILSFRIMSTISCIKYLRLHTPGPLSHFLQFDPRKSCGIL